MEESKKGLKVYFETTFWSYLNGGRTPLEHIAINDRWTMRASLPYHNNAGRVP